ncbi:hypothetical protein FP384_20240, partial [Klebsiella pneumoniae]|nr:hypothetical protein [Klebsiella pneumoniae]
MKITIFAVFIFDKSKTFIFKPRCDCSVHRHYRITRWLTPRFYVSTSKSIIKALINMHSFEIQL